MKSRMLLIAVVTLLAASIVAGCTAGATPTAQPTTSAGPVASPPGVTAEGRLEPIKYTNVALAADGSVSQLLAAQGEQVTAGQVIAVIQNADAKTLAQAQASAASELASAYQAMHDAQDALDAFPIPGKFTGMTAEQATRTSLQNLEAARTQFEPYKENSVQGYRFNNDFPSLPRFIWVDTGRYKKGLEREYKKQLDNAWVDYRRAVQWLDLESALETAQARAAQAQRDVDRLQDASLAEDTAGTRAALANAELRAPFAGTITNLDLKVGESVAPGKPVVTIADFSSWVVKTTDLTEIDVVNVKEGQPVTMTLDAIPGVTLNGYVLTIGQNYSERQGDVVYEATILLTDPQPAMRWGMTAKLHFAE